MIEITSAPLHLEALIEAVTAPHTGAVTSFLGIVRNHNHGRQVLYLDYECYKPMAIKELQKIVVEAKQRWPIHEVAIAHRTGKMEIGEASVAIAVSSVHRKESIEAVHFVIDTLKKTVPIWKKEYFEGGEIWLEGCSH